MKRFYIYLILASLALASCSVNDYKRLELKSWDVRSVDNFSYAKGSASADVCLEIAVSNPTGSGFELKALTATLYSEKGSKVADAVAQAPVVLGPKCDTLLPVMFNATLFNPMATILGAKMDPETMSADLDMTVKSGPFTKRIQKEKMPLKGLLDEVQSVSPVEKK